MPLPPQAVAQQRAREAINMQLVTASLAQSEFASETWTLQDCSKEMYNTEPQNTFKKQGTQVDVYYDGSDENCMRYVLWERIYYMTEDDLWAVAEGQVDNEGLYYMRGGLKEYYVRFEADVGRYSRTGQYTIKCKDKDMNFFNPVSSSTPTSARRVRGQSEDDPGQIQERARKRQRRSLVQEAGGPDPTRGRRGGRAEEGQEGSRASSTDGGSERPLLGSAAGGPFQPEGRHREPSRPQGPQPHLAPILVVQGPCNALKCQRYRWKHIHRDLFTDITTNFRWMPAGGIERGELAQLIVRFDSESQRDAFLDSGAITSTLSALPGTMPVFT
ncbi:E2 [Eidolon helvum papillomavirus 2]|uniref:Protein E8^E2C n=1 Tax=Eidolon helvum papillomavirus 2 TaxID=1335476 RepID=A0A1P8YVV3_9PAPI|nr:E2 [Eidolon helvum papillomavirus 2]AQA28218.1 E2 [Eidolon helvum papillomavirus 2]